MLCFFLHSIKISTNATREQRIVMHVNAAPTHSALINVHVKQDLKETKRPGNVTVIHKQYINGLSIKTIPLNKTLICFVYNDWFFCHVLCKIICLGLHLLIGIIYLFCSK